MLEELVERRGNKRMGFSMLIIAFFVGDIDLVEELLEDGMDPNQTDINGRSAIWWAENGWRTDDAVVSFPL
jgi:ankyrin repeat protein